MSVPSAWNPTPEALLVERDWARRLARRLVRDAALAEDLAQEATLRALGRAPESGLRAWLGGVVRNLARQGRRERGRRARREERAARPEAELSAAEALERLAVQQEVVRAVLALSEPYRSTVVLRFYEELPPRAIAARQGVPVATVKTRLARGLAQLRERLDHEHGGDGRAWALFLAPLAARPLPIPPLLAGALAVNALPKLLAAAAATVGIVFWLATRTNLPRAPADEVVEARTPAELQTPPALAEEPAAVTPQREAAPVAAEAAAQRAAPPAELATITGRVLDAQGAPVPGVALGLRLSRGVRMDAELRSSILWHEELALGSEPLAFSGADGRFALTRQEASGYVVSLDPRWETVLGGGLPEAPEQEAILVVAPLFRLRGRVVDGSGAPRAGAELVFVVERERLELSGLDLERSRTNGWSTMSAADGSFAFERLPSVPGATLHVRLAPYARQALARDAWHDDELEIVLQEPEGGWLEGRVESGGRALAGATVALGYRAAESGPDGGFRLSLAGLEQERELLAAARGLLPARVLGDESEDGSVRWPAFVRIELAGEPLALAGVVVDEHGIPLAGHEVWLEDPTVACLQGQGFALLLESLVAGDPDMRHGTQTDAEGRFELAGLDRRAYTLRVIAPASALVLDFGPFEAGARDLRLERPPGSVWPRLRGRVRARSGAPLAGANVSIDADAGMVGARDQYLGFVAYGARTLTAEDGSFELANVPCRGARLHVQGPGLADPELELEPGLDPDALEITVAASVQLLVRLGTTHADATRFAVLDGAGAAVELTVPTDGGRLSARSIELARGLSPVTRLSDEGLTLVLYRDETELARVPLALRADRINEIDLP